MKRKQNQILQRLLRDISTQPGLLLLALIGTIVQVALTIYLPVLIGEIIDAVVEVNASEQVLALLRQMVFVIIFNTLIQWGNPLLYNQLVYQYSKGMRNRVMQHIHQLPLSYLDKQSTGDLVSRLTTDVDQLNNGLLMVFNQFLSGVLTILVTIVTMAQLDLVMMLAVLVLTPFSLVIAQFIAKKSYKLFQAQTESRGVQTQLIEETLTQESLIQASNAQEQFKGYFQTINATYATYSQSAIFYSSTVNPSTRFINAVIYAVIAAIGTSRIMQGGSLTVGQLVTFLNYVNQYSKPFNDISSVMSELQSSLACAERLYSILDESKLEESGKNKLESEAVQGEIQFHHVRFGYEKNQVLMKDFHIQIPAGSKVAIVGPTGAGKSTLINLLMRFYPVDGGEILLDGVPIVDYTRESYRKHFGMVLQETWLKVGTIHDNIAYGHPKASREEVIAAAKAANADFFIRQLPDGYDTYLTDAGESLSQGQRQLLTIARVFLAIPKILILDEATSSIDTRTELLVQAAFAKLMENRTSFIIAHRLSTIQNADLILVMVAGDIAEYGNHQELMEQKGIYYRMQTAQ
ncbi:ABC transporter, ATP-binding/permease protein [Streptococcus sp. DD10]|uniref:ABC transporter ATP-binding protein n=1 Tax=Streptococcus sp. DD10 TaxID=1777878 RepID=UPI0007924114|nr:ABC transporter ATP-binding protein [Streptococcus sp. DD10]KXT73353.1 ABC transporter, ATP-binding/permease protein [Streptococcus sp. DD10]